MPAPTAANFVAYTLQVAAIVAIGAGLPFILRMTVPRARLTYWRALLIASLIVPFLQMTAPPLTAALSARTLRSSLEVTVTGSRIGDAPAPDVSQSPSWPLATVVGAVLAAGALARLGWLGLGLLTLRRLRRHAPLLLPRPPAVDEACELVQADAEFRATRAVARPVTFGAALPVVLVPEQFASFDRGQQKAIACHELLHVRRHDWLRTTADELVRAVAWFHPAVWWLMDQIQLAREQVVDREVVRLVGTRQPYLEALLRMAVPSARPALRPASLFLKRAHLRERVTLLVKEVPMSRPRLVLSFAVMAIVLFLGSRVVLNAFPLQALQAAAKPVAQAPATLPNRAPMDLQFTNAKLSDVLNVIGRAARLGVSIDPGAREAVSRPVTVSLKHVTLEQALSAVLGLEGLVYQLSPDGAAIRILSPATRQPAGGVAGGVLGVTGGIVESARQETKSGVVGGVPGGVSGGIVDGVAGGVPGGVSGGVARGVVGGGSAGVAGAKTPGEISEGNRPLAQGPPMAAPQRVTPPAVLTRVDPVYPAAAQQAGTTGVVILQATIDASGLVSDVRVLRGPSALSDAAMDAARQWVFEAPKEAPLVTIMGFNFPGKDAPAGGLAPDAPRVGGTIPPPTKIRDVKPVYPPEAISQNVQGIEIIEAVLDPSGNVLNARGLRGEELLMVPALDAVLRWKFAMANIASRLLMTVTVNFALDTGKLSGVAETPATPDGLRPIPPGWPTNALRVGGNIKPPAKILDVKPVYPEVAEKAKVQGVVIVETLIGPDGKVQDARILRSIPLLDQAALEAVRQWAFTPTLLNGAPVPIVMTVTVNFALR